LENRKKPVRLKGEVLETENMLADLITRDVSMLKKKLAFNRMPGNDAKLINCEEDKRIINAILGRHH